VVGAGLTLGLCSAEAGRGVGATDGTVDAGDCEAGYGVGEWAGEGEEADPSPPFAKDATGFGMTVVGGGAGAGGGGAGCLGVGGKR
jgi:hypothetical protein